jgi:hypothetical protein
VILDLGVKKYKKNKLTWPWTAMEIKLNHKTDFEGYIEEIIPLVG